VTPDSSSDSLKQRISGNRSRGVLEITLSSSCVVRLIRGSFFSECEAATGEKSSERFNGKGRCGIDLSLRVEGTTGAEIMTYGPEDRGPCCRQI